MLMRKDTCFFRRFLMPPSDDEITRLRLRALPSTVKSQFTIFFDFIPKKNFKILNL